METTSNLLNNELQIDSRIAVHLKEAAGWAKFLGIIGFVFAGIVAIIAFAAPAMMSSYSYNPYGNSYGYSSGMNAARGMITVVYLLAAVILFFVALFTYKFGSKTKEALAMSDQLSLDKGMMNLKFLFRFYGIVAIIYLGIIILALLFGGMAMVMRH